MRDPIKVLYVSSEVYPYLPESTISNIGRYLPQGVQERGGEIRLFMPRYGLINERRNQLHEVIRLSGMNLVINDTDHSLIIKVSSISAARMQVYFIDNEEYFSRKFIYGDPETEPFFKDNDERALFFAKGVLETVKRLRWKPDIIHIQGWFSHFLPLFIEKMYSNDPLFSHSKIILSLYNEMLDSKLSSDVASKIVYPAIKSKELTLLSDPTLLNLAKLAIKHSHAVIVGEDQLNSELSKLVEESSIPSLGYIDTHQEESNYIEEYHKFYQQIITE
ncbi:MAG: glycogen/starch synthase [Bacteroidales bacterium]